MPDLIGLTALGSLTIQYCNKLKTLPRGLGKLGALKQLTLGRLDGELPCIEALTALHELCLDVADYAQGSRAFTVLSRSLPCLQQLQVLRLRASDVDQGLVALQATGRACHRPRAQGLAPAPAPRCQSLCL